MKLELMIELLSEAAQEARSFDIQEIVKTFKNKADIEKHLRKLWGSKHLTFRGQPFFANDQDGAVIKGAKKAVDRELKGTIDIDLEYKSEQDVFDITVDEVKLVYMGYSQSNDMLYLGYDVWMNGEEIENAFDKLYEKETGEEFNIDDPEMEKEFMAWRKKYDAFFGALVEVRSDDGKRFEADLLHADAGGFYKGIAKGYQYKSMKLIDLMNS